ncbi:MAG: tRNA (N6-threonylcarbamoyladenosine(37)-N6)-methyltransferase TrmO [Cyanobacteria bacterium J06638_28]
MQPIGIVRSPYTERHGTPRQSQLSTAPANYEPAIARIELFPDRIPPEALRDLDGFEYLWVIAWLHLNKHWNPTVIPPRGPRIRRGTLATRAPHRPNPLGLSATRILKVEGQMIHVAGIDLLDQTPVLDIKPYVPYCDAFPNAQSGYVDIAEQAIAAETDIFGQAGHPFKQT